MDRPGGQDHVVSRPQEQALAARLEDEGDGAVNAVEDLLVGVAVGRIAVVGTVRPGVAALGLRLQLRHQLRGGCHQLNPRSGDPRIVACGSDSSPTPTWAGWPAGCARSATTPPMKPTPRTAPWSGGRWPKAASCSRATST